MYDQALRTGGRRKSFRKLDRENSLVHLLRVELLKRMESSVSLARLTLEKILGTIDRAIERIDEFERSGTPGVSVDDMDGLDKLDLTDPQFEDSAGGRQGQGLPPGSST